MSVLEATVAIEAADETKFNKVAELNAVIKNGDRIHFKIGSRYLSLIKADGQVRFEKNNALQRWIRNAQNITNSNSMSIFY